MVMITVICRPGWLKNIINIIIYVDFYDNIHFIGCLTRGMRAEARFRSLSALRQVELIYF